MRYIARIVRDVNMINDIRSRAAVCPKKMTGGPFKIDG
jgi:hypothetical protein